MLIILLCSTLSSFSWKTISSINLLSIEIKTYYSFTIQTGPYHIVADFTIPLSKSRKIKILQGEEKSATFELKSGIRGTILVDITPISGGEPKNYFGDSYVDMQKSPFSTKVAVRRYCQNGGDMCNILIVSTLNI